MTARQDLSAVLLNGGAATNALASGLIDAYRAEVLAEAADRPASQPTFQGLVRQIRATANEELALPTTYGKRAVRDFARDLETWIPEHFAPVPAADELVSCSRCRGGERYGKTAERGWTRHAGGYLCPKDAATSPPQSDQLAAYQVAVSRALELLETAPEAFLTATSNNIRAAASALREVHDTPTLDFFQPARTYTANMHANIAFDCLAVSVDPNTGEQVAIGWRYGPLRDGVRAIKLAALDAAAFACCDWTETAPGGAK